MSSIPKALDFFNQKWGAFNESPNESPSESPSEGTGGTSGGRRSENFSDLIYSFIDVMQSGFTTEHQEDFTKFCMTNDEFKSYFRQEYEFMSQSQSRGQNVMGAKMKKYFMFLFV